MGRICQGHSLNMMHSCSSLKGRRACGQIWPLVGQKPLTSTGGSKIVHKHLCMKVSPCRAFQSWYKRLQPVESLANLLMFAVTMMWGFMHASLQPPACCDNSSPKCACWLWQHIWVCLSLAWAKCMVLSYAPNQGVVLPLARVFGDIQSPTAGILMLSICIKRLCRLPKQPL